MLRAFLPAFVLGCLVAIAPSCGRQCTPSNCLGCCNDDGVCAPGVSVGACGVDGAVCSVCVGAQTCGGGVCEGSSATGGGVASGGGSATGGGAGGGGMVMLDTRNRVFVTSADYAGDLGGLTGADVLCQNAATAANKGGTWKAFVSNSVESAVSRMAEVGPWYQERSTGEFVVTFNNKANLTTSPLATLYVDEQGRGSSTFPPTYWTGTSQTGAASSYLCSDWDAPSSSTRGTLGSGGRWDNEATAYCTSSYPLVCFEQSREPRPAPLPTTRKRLFVTSADYAGDLGGLTGADSLCQNAATAANKGGTWKAFLSNGVESAVARMADVGPWYQERNTGEFVVTFNNKANLTTSPLATLYVDEQGRGSSTFPPTYWTGTSQTGAASPYLCSDWDAPSSSSRGTLGSGGRWDNEATAYCTSSYPLVCFEQ